MKIYLPRAISFAIAGTAAFFISCSSDGGSGGGIQIPESSSSLPSSNSNVVYADFSRAIEINKKLGRGVNLGNAFDADCRRASLCEGYPYQNALAEPTGGWDNCWSNGIKDDYFEILKTDGFNSIRLPVRWGAAASDVAPFAIPPSLIAKVKETVNKAIEAGFPVILNIHHYNELYDDSKCRSDFELQKTKFVELWRQIASEFKTYSNDYLIFEILNEPRQRVTLPVLNSLLEEVFPIIRAENPGRTIMINSTNWGKYTTIQYIKIPGNDPNVILSGHFYEPQGFTHQGESAENPIGIRWNSAADQAGLVKTIDEVYKELENKYINTGAGGGTIPVNIGEFGGSNKAELADRALWLSVIVKEFEKRNMSWHYWAFPRAGAFDGYNYVERTWIPEIKNALTPSEAK